MVPWPPYSPDVAPCGFFVPPTEERAEGKALGVGGEHPSSRYKVPERHSSRGVPGCIPGVADSSPQGY